MGARVMTKVIVRKFASIYGGMTCSGILRAISFFCFFAGFGSGGMIEDGVVCAAEEDAADPRVTPERDCNSCQ